MIGPQVMEAIHPHTEAHAINHAVQQAKKAMAAQAAAASSGTGQPAPPHERQTSSSSTGEQAGHSTKVKHFPDWYPWKDVYPEPIEQEYVDNWDKNLDPEHMSDWKRLVEEILGPPSKWWKMLEAGTPLGELVKEAAEDIEYWVSPYDNVDPHGIKYAHYCNTRYGAWKTLQLGYGNCCDHAHVMVALCRAAGIAVRYRHEVTYFPDYGTEDHVCVDVGIPTGVYLGKDGHYHATGVKWVRMDPTNPYSKCVRLEGVYANLPF